MLNYLYQVFNKDKLIKICFYKNKIDFYHICKKFIFTFVKILKVKIKKYHSTNLNFLMKIWI